MMSKIKVLQIESAQGFELGINSGSHYPYCTGRDITPHQILADCAVPYGINPKIIVTMRTFPIRVGDQYDKDGNKVGTSGPVYNDQEELNWADIGIPEEKTTVTGKVRRIFTWSNLNLVRMIQTVNPDFMFLNFVNYLQEDEIEKFIFNIGTIWGINLGIRPTEAIDRIRWSGYGARDIDVKAHFPETDRLLIGR